MLDPIRPHLAPDVWGQDNKILPTIKKQILEKVNNLVDKNYYQVFVIGSIVGYKYSDTSDIDVNVTVPDEMLTPELWEIRRRQNGKPAHGTRHPINIYFQGRDSDEPLEWQDSKYGVYNLLEDVWEIKPVPPSELRPPGEQYFSKLRIARIVRRYFARLEKEWKRDIKELLILKSMPPSEELNNKIRRKEIEIQEDNRRLEEFSKLIDQNRKTNYQFGWGTPRDTYDNVVYKLLEHSNYRNIFEYFLEKTKNK